MTQSLERSQLDPFVASYSLVDGARAQFELDPDAVAAAQALEELAAERQLARQQETAQNLGPIAVSNS